MYNFDKIKILKLNIKKHIFYIKNEKYLVKIKIIFFIIVLWQGSMTKQIIQVIVYSFIFFHVGLVY